MIYLVDIPTGGKGKGKKGKGRGDMEMVEGTIIKDFRTEYAKSGAAKCRTCEEKIPKVCLFEPRSDEEKHNFKQICNYYFPKSSLFDNAT